jgi:hypothetical protein
MRHLTRFLLAAVFTTAVATVAAPAGPASAAPGSRCAQTAVGLIAGKWRSLGAENGPLGCPTTPERDVPGRRGRVSTFEHGEIVWSPDQGGQLVVAAYQQDRGLVVDWGPTAPFRYDFFLVRHDLDGRNAGQREVKGRDHGRTVIPVSRDGRYTVIVEGCVSRLLRSARCSRHWTVPATVAVRLPAPPPVRHDDPVLSAVQDGDRLFLRWDKVWPGWPFFNVRWSVNGDAELQRETPRNASGVAQNGQYVVQLPPGTRAGTTYTFRVQGCSRDTVLWFTVKTRCGNWTPAFPVAITRDVPPRPMTPATPNPTGSAAPTGGLGGLIVYNCHADNRDVHIWMVDRAPDGTETVRDRGDLAVQYENPDNAPLRGSCPATGSDPIELSFADGHHYRVVVVDPGAIGCPGNDPNVHACQRRWVEVTGNSRGPRPDLVVE